MKQNLLLIIFFSTFLICYSQGIEFEQSNWNEVLEKATQNQKPIFVDIYTTWCRPCKVMNTQVFSLAEVGEVYNSKFICVKIDAEKEDGINIVKDYDIQSYPTYLFLDKTGELILKAKGSMSQDEFLALATNVENELDNPRSIIDWDNEYAWMKTDTAFLRLYMEKQALLGKSNTVLFDEYLALLPVEQRASKSIIDIYFREKDNIKIHSLAYSNLQDNRAKFTKLGSISVVFMLSAIENSLLEAIKDGNEKLLEEVVAENEKIPLLFMPERKEYFYLRYYKATNDLEKFISNAIIYGTANSVHIPPAIPVIPPHFL
ncbi:MAG: thioredoxin family protein [Bacteroidales bacterium]|jgi:thioredoxin-related protein|nr:thioredoxin family protein [Bacteroidales bacterium]